MPYVPKTDRATAGIVPETPGELNYAITVDILYYLSACRDEDPDGRVRYEHFNAAIGVLESAKLELYRRMVVPYEDEKIRENGDVYPLDIASWVSL